MSELDRYTIKQYEIRLRTHIEAVREIGRSCGLPEAQLQAHDLSKWSEEEFDPYARYFIDIKGGGSSEVLPTGHVPPDMARAWLHHIHHNKHHWQHWIFPDTYNPPGANLENGVMEMPEKYALEMICDWHGASYAYTDSFNIQDWLLDNVTKIVVHSNTARYLEGKLTAMDYELAGRKFATRL